MVARGDDGAVMIRATLRNVRVTSPRLGRSRARRAAVAAF
jgi:hypothetical protein